MTQRFAGQVAAISGGAAGIGLAVARRMTAEGGRAVLWDLDGAAAERAAATLEGAMAIAVDVTDADAVLRATERTVATCGRLDIMVASAGITGPNATTWEYPLDQWRKVLAVDLDGVFHCFRAVAPIMRDAGYGRIVALASMAGKEGNAKAPAYSAAKAGVIGLTKSMGKELAGTGVTVNCVAPAAVRTAIFDQMEPNFVEFLLSKIPMGRFGTTEEVAALICWIASREASFSTGATFDCSGGRAVF